MEHDTKAPNSPAVAGLVERTVRPCAWTAHSWLASRNGGHFVPERRHAFDVPLYDQAALEAAVATERAESARLRHLLNLARDDYNTAAQRLQDIGDYAHDHSTGPAVPDALWEVRSMAYGSGA